MKKDPYSRTIFVDIESAGLCSRSPIIQLAAVAVQSGSYKELDTIDMLIQFEMKDVKNLRSLGITKFSPSRWQQYAIPEQVAAEKFAIFLRRHSTVEKKSKQGKVYRIARLAAHNSAFDGRMLENWYKRLGIFYPATLRTLCTEQKARWFYEDNGGLVPPDNYQLVTLARHLQLQHQPDHTALQDIRATVELARVLAELSRIAVTAQAA